MKEITLKKRRAIIIIVLLLFLCAVIGYRAIYKPRVEAKNYASYAAICLAIMENHLIDFDSANLKEQKKRLKSISGIWGIFCEIECPHNRRTTEIQWKMAKLIGYTESFVKQEIDNVYMGNESNEALRNIKERIADLKWLIEDTIAYGNFKRIK